MEKEKLLHILENGKQIGISIQFENLGMIKGQKFFNIDFYFQPHPGKDSRHEQ